jgi:hypothetical protein
VTKSKPTIEWDDLYASTDFRLLWRFQRADETVVVNAREVGHGVEIWTQAITTHGPETLARERFGTPEELEPYLRATKARYGAEGWQIVETTKKRR